MSQIHLPQSQNQPLRHARNHLSTEHPSRSSADIEVAYPVFSPSAHRILHSLLHSFDTVHHWSAIGLWTGTWHYSLDCHLPILHCLVSVGWTQNLPFMVIVCTLLKHIHLPASTLSSSLVSRDRISAPKLPQEAWNLIHSQNSPLHFALHYSPHSLHLPPPVPWPNQQYIRVWCQNVMVS